MELMKITPHVVDIKTYYLGDNGNKNQSCYLKMRSSRHEKNKRHCTLGL